MNKLWLIIEREYLTRVKKKSFILVTLLGPFVFVALFTVPALLAIYTGQEQKSVVVKDDAGILATPAEEDDRVKLSFSQEPLETLKISYKKMGYDGVLHLPSPGAGSNFSAAYFSDEQLSFSAARQLEEEVADALKIYKVKAAGYSDSLLQGFETEVSIEQRDMALNEQGEAVETNKKTSAGIASAIGFASGFIIYMVLLIYGTMIMRSVMEEKTTRIVEVIISSVRPFQLMLGKIVGVSAVGLTQMLVWIVLTVGLMMLATSLLPIDPAAMQPGVMNGVPPPAMAGGGAEILATLAAQNWAYILPAFLFYFIGGYFIYASLFAAVGSAMGDDMGEGQSLTFVAMAPIILSITLISPVVENPNSPLAVWMSIIPLFSPVIMPARLAFEPPLWQLLLSMLVLAASSVFFVWLAGRIYRVGIMMYGKKASFKELGKWLFYKD